MSTYSYPISSTSTGTCAPEQLQRQIEESGSILAQCLGVTIDDETTIVIEFDVALTPPEVLSLDAVVAAHAPVATPSVFLLTDHNTVFDADGRLVYSNQGIVLVTA